MICTPPHSTTRVSPSAYQSTQRQGVNRLSFIFNGGKLGDPLAVGFMRHSI
jgi:hypothetical protein